MAAKPGKGLRGRPARRVGKNQRAGARVERAAYPLRLAQVKKWAIDDSFGEIPMKIFETLVVIGFALRYHSNAVPRGGRRQAGRRVARARIRRCVVGVCLSTARFAHV
ncbi:hypothetical protein BVI2075_570014 [Burkholderia vietnamiensis]|nr:hypothetical protein BVI1335_1260003 [Burkholderia vietnamiensis]CAG9213732.1 hypothetical protein BVI2075_570014 [Burkholderia vietnamiensis]